jgi:hypothetical protein
MFHDAEDAGNVRASIKFSERQFWLTPDVGTNDLEALQEKVRIGGQNVYGYMHNCPCRWVIFDRRSHDGFDAPV